MQMLSFAACRTSALRNRRRDHCERKLLNALLHVLSITDTKHATKYCILELKDILRVLRAYITP